MNEHPHDLLPAFALGALDVDEANQVLQHVAVCTPCRADVEAWGTIVELLPYTVAPHSPSAHIKRQLFAMIDASADARPGTADAAPSRQGPMRRWMGALTAGALALALVFGLLLANERGRTDMLTAQLDERERTLQRLNNQLAERNLTIQQVRMQLDRELQATVFMATAIGQPLKGARAGVQGKMYMKPGDTYAVLVVHGLQPPPAGKVYQLWLATADTQVPSGILTVGLGGTATLAIEAPAPVDSYTQVMVTVEQAPGSQAPSDQIVLGARL
jgi:anti-sigma-K factor RskA